MYRHLKLENNEIFTFYKIQTSCCTHPTREMFTLENNEIFAFHKIQASDAALIQQAKGDVYYKLL